MSHEFTDQFRRILQITGHADYCIARAFEECVKRRPKRAKIADIEDHLDACVPLRNGSQNFLRAVDRRVIDEKYLEADVRDLREYCAQSFI